MNAENRRKAVAEALSAQEPISAASLAARFSVSRQVIVGDVALLRAGGLDVVATPRGYRLGKPAGMVRTVACLHSMENLELELLTMVDNGCTVNDVVVEHPLYGELTGQLNLSSRYDVAQFVEQCRHTTPLLSLTGGVHLHNLTCPDEETYQRVCRQLDEEGILYKNPETND